MTYYSRLPFLRAYHRPINARQKNDVRPGRGLNNVLETRTGNRRRSVCRHRGRKEGQKQWDGAGSFKSPPIRAFFPPPHKSRRARLHAVQRARRCSPQGDRFTNRQKHWRRSTRNRKKYGYDLKHFLAVFDFSSFRFFFRSAFSKRLDPSFRFWISVSSRVSGFRSG